MRITLCTQDVEGEDTSLAVMGLPSCQRASARRLKVTQDRSRNLGGFAIRPLFRSGSFGLGTIRVSNSAPMPEAATPLKE